MIPIHFQNSTVKEGGKTVGSIGIKLEADFATVHARRLEEYASADWAADFLHAVAREKVSAIPEIKFSTPQWQVN